MTHLNFNCVQARLNPRSCLPADATIPPQSLHVSSTCTALDAGPIFVWVALESTIGCLSWISRPPSQSALRWRLSWAGLVFLKSFCFASSLFFLSPSPHRLLKRFCSFHKLHQQKTSLAKSCPFLHLTHLLDIDCPFLYAHHTHLHHATTTNRIPHHHNRSLQRISSISNISSESPQISIILPDSTAILALHFHPSLRDA
ncbi:hypothetical protein V8C40DRAFT_211401 [Trichoderma camerunense]